MWLLVKYFESYLEDITIVKHIALVDSCGRVATGKVWASRAMDLIVLWRQRGSFNTPPFFFPPHPPVPKFLFLYVFGIFVIGFFKGVGAAPSPVATPQVLAFLV